MSYTINMDEYMRLYGKCFTEELKKQLEQVGVKDIKPSICNSVFCKIELAMRHKYDMMNVNESDMPDKDKKAQLIVLDDLHKEYEKRLLADAQSAKNMLSEALFDALFAKYSEKCIGDTDVKKKRIFRIVFDKVVKRTGCRYKLLDRRIKDILDILDKVQNEKQEKMRCALLWEM